MAKITQAFRRSALRRGVVVKTNKNYDTPAHVTNAAVMELANLGFLASPEVLKGMSTSALTTLFADARAVIGADRNMLPVYPGFPKQVEDLDTLTLLVEQILHYMTHGAFSPDYPTVVRESLPLEDMVFEARTLRSMTAAPAARELIRDLATSPTAMSDDDKDLLKGAVELSHLTADQLSEIAGDARNGENLQTLVRTVLDVTSLPRNDVFSAVAPQSSNLDQLLRVILAVHSVDADTSAYTSGMPSKWMDNYELAVENLADRHARAVRMARVSRPQRREIVELLGALSTGFKADRLVNRQNLWRTVLRAVHPYDLRLTDEQKRAADIVHSNIEYRTVNSLVEEALENRDVTTAVELLRENKPGELLRSIVSILRRVNRVEGATALADAIREVGARSPLTTLISSYNGVLSANSERARVTRVAGINNTMVDRSAVEKVSEDYLELVLEGIRGAMSTRLSNMDAPADPVAVDGSIPVPLVRRDAATTDRVMDRGQTFALAGDGDGSVLRIFGHWNNNQSESGYMDIGAVVLDENFTKVASSTWNSWHGAREWSTYSGDKYVHPGQSAAEYFDLKLDKMRKLFPTSKWVAMTVQSWSGWPMKNVDFIAGAMLRSDATKGETFDPRSVSTVFKPTTESTQAVPFAVNIHTGELVWIDSSSGSTDRHVSSNDDGTVGDIVYDEIERPRLTMGELATMWAEAHGVETMPEEVDREQVLNLLK